MGVAVATALTACHGGGGSDGGRGGEGRGPSRVGGGQGGGAKPYVGGARDSFGGVVVLADH